MFILYADKNKLTVHHREPTTSGSMNVYQVRFHFSPEWDGLERTAVFRGGGELRSVLLDSSNECVVPWEVLTKSGGHLMVGVYGTQDGITALPTVWADCGYILEGAVPGESTRLPTPGQYEQALSQLEKKQDKLSGQPGQVVGFDEEGNAVAQEPPSSGSAYRFGHGLKQDGDLVTVDTAEGFDGDKTLPISAAAVETAVGNIQILLETI